jgi:chromate transporter
LANGKTSLEGGAVVPIIKENCDADLRRRAAVATFLMLRERPGDCPAVEQLQGVQRSAAGVYEKLRRTDLQNRISDLHEVVPKEINRDQVHIISDVSDNNRLKMTDIPAGQKVADQEELGHGISFGEAFGIWLRVALLSFGGPAGQIAVMHRILVEEKNWISESRFLHALNYCMLLPGPEAQQLATYIGWLLHRTAGGIMAGGLFILPGIICIMGLSYIYAAFGKVGFIEALFFGLKAAVLAIVIQAVVRVGKRALRNRIMIALAAIAFIAIFFFAVPFPIIIISAGVIGYVGARIGRPEFAAVVHGGGKDAVVDSMLGEDLPEHVRPTVPRALKVSAVWLLLWLVPVAALLIAFGQANVFSQIALFFSKMAMVTFGGAYAVLAYVAQQAVEHYHWVSPREMLDGLGMAETTPGPLIMVLQFVGFMAAYRDPGTLSPMLAGTLGGLLATWVTFTPCFLWIFLGAPFVETLRGNKGLAGALTAITAAVVGVILNLSIWFALHTVFQETWPVRSFGLSFDMPVLSSIDVPALILAVAAATAIFRFNLGMLTVLAGSCAAGVLLRLTGVI